MTSDLARSAGVLAAVEASTGSWWRVADALEAAGDPPQASPPARESGERWKSFLSRLFAEDADVELATVLDRTYPANLRQIFNRPPFLFLRGGLTGADERSLAVVGTRHPSTAGRMAARELAGRLADAGVTVVSGLARGIDAEAHEAALAAHGRTIAVLGSGIRRVYPPEHGDLADRIALSGAVVSQFWPDSPPSRGSFPQRNVVTSGIALGTLVVEAAADSGARMQARLAREHGRPVFLTESLVRSEPWASDLVQRGEARSVRAADDLLPQLAILLEAGRRQPGVGPARGAGLRPPGSTEQLRLL